MLVLIVSTNRDIYKNVYLVLGEQQIDRKVFKPIRVLPIAERQETKNMNTKDKKEIAEIVLSILNAQNTVKTPVQQEKKTSPVKEHARADIPGLLKALTKEETIEKFGEFRLNPKETPYACEGITRFFKDNNVVLKGFQRVGFNYAEKHLIIEAQLKGETPKNVAKYRENCLLALKTRLSLNEKQTNPKIKENVAKAINSEIARWN